MRSKVHYSQCYSSISKLQKDEPQLSTTVYLGYLVVSVNGILREGGGFAGVVGLPSTRREDVLVALVPTPFHYFPRV